MMEDIAYIPISQELIPFLNKNSYYLNMIFLIMRYYLLTQKMKSQVLSQRRVRILINFNLLCHNKRVHLTAIPLRPSALFHSGK